MKTDVLVSLSRRLSLVLVCISLVGMVGCADSDAGRPQRVKVSGIVTYQDAPLADAILVFSPDGHTNTAFASTDSQGRFQLSTFGANDGAVPGDYIVTVQKVGQTSEAASEGGAAASKSLKSLVPVKYDSASSSDLKVTVTSEGKNDVALVLTGELSDKPLGGASQKTSHSSE